MKNIPISDQVAHQLHELASDQQTSISELIELLLIRYQSEITKRKELKTFFKPYQNNYENFNFDREEANVR